MIQLKCCTQYVSKFGKLSSVYRTGKGQFSFQSQRRAMPKIIQTALQLHSFHMLARLFSKSLKLHFRTTWMENFQIHKLGFKEIKEQKTNFQCLLDHRVSKEVSEKTSSYASSMLKHFTVWITTNCEKFLKRWEYQTTLPVSWGTRVQDKKRLEPDMEQ